MRVLIVEDEAVHADAAAKALLPMGHDIIKVDDGEKAVNILKAETVDVVVLDWRLPRMSGFEVLNWIRGNLGRVPAVLFLSSKVLEVDIVRALEAGADDYIVKPFRIAELSARVNVLLRRIKQETFTGSIIRVREFTLDFRARTVFLRNEPIALTPKEFDLTAFFFNNIGRLLSREAVSSSTWGREFDVSSRTLDTHVYRIRLKLGLTPQNGLRLRSIYTHGYRLDEVMEHIDPPV